MKKITIISKLVDVQKRIRQNFHTTNLPYSELILRQNFRKAKDSYGEISYSKIPLWRNFPTVKFPHGKISLQRSFLRQIFPRRFLLQQNFLAPYTTFLRILHFSLLFIMTCCGVFYSSFSYMDAFRSICARTRSIRSYILQLFSYIRLYVLSFWRSTHPLTPSQTTHPPTPATRAHPNPCGKGFR